MTHAAYLADPVHGGSLSASIASILLERSPLHAWHASPALNPAWHRREYDSATQKRMDFGSAVHCLVLEPAKAESKIVVCPFADWRKDAAKEMRATAHEAGMIPLLQADYDDAERMARGIWKQLEKSEIGEIVMAGGTAEQVAIWQEDGGITCRARLDWLADDGSLILDLKTTGGSAQPDSWARGCLPEGGDIQAAMYARGIGKIFPGRPAPLFVFAVFESEAPYAGSLVSLDPVYLSLAEEKVCEALDLWARCMTSGKWPGYPSRIAYAAPQSYLQTQWDERAVAAMGMIDPEQAIRGPQI
jgi:hypothetical protein